MRINGKSKITPLRVQTFERQALNRVRYINIYYFAINLYLADFGKQLQVSTTIYDKL